MLDSRNRKSGCEFGEAVLDYVYGELGEEALHAFKAHLESCAECSQESAALASMSKAVGEWKSHQFDGLAMPRIDIPKLTESEASGPAVAPVSWMGRLRDLFAANSLAFRTVAAVVLIAFVAGLGWLYFGGGSAGDGLAGNDPGPKAPTSGKESLSNDGVQGTEPELANAARENNAENQGIKEGESVRPGPLPVLSAVDNSKIKRAKVRKPVRKKSNKKKPAGTRAPSSPVPEISPIDRLTTLATSEETEDEGLRLIELFEDSGSEDR